MTLKIYKSKPRIGKPYSQQPGRKQGEGTGHIVDKIDLSPKVWYHGSVSGDLRGGRTGLHLGTYEAATQALEARIGVPAEGEWDGKREYGKTKLMGETRLRQLEKKGIYKYTGINCDCSKEDYYPIPGKLKYGDDTPVPMDVKPEVAPYNIIGKMTNNTFNPHRDEVANGLMYRQLKQGKAKNGFYYTNISEDKGSISAVVPNGSHLKKVT